MGEMHPFSALRVRGPLVLLFAVAALTVAPPVAAPHPGSDKHGQGGSQDGQAQQSDQGGQGNGQGKHAGRGDTQAPSQVNGPALAAPAPDPGAAKAVAKEASKQAKEAAKQVEKAGHQTVAAVATAQVSVPAAPVAVVAAVPVVTPVTPAPAAPAPAPAAQAPVPATHAQAPVRHGRARNLPAGARGGVGAAGASAPGAAGPIVLGAAATPPSGAALGALGASAPRPSSGSRSGATRARRGAGQRTAPRQAPAASQLIHTVVRVFSVIPAWLLTALAALAALGLALAGAVGKQTVRARRLERQRRRLIADVGVLQSALLPELPAMISGARVTAAYRPAEGLGAGGDFYDAFGLPGGRVAVLVGDVAGHGRDVVPLTALVRYSLRAYLEAGLAPRAALHIASNVLGPQLGGRMVTVAAAIFDPAGGRLTYACAGHWPPLLLGTPVTPVTACSSPPIGVGAMTGQRQTTIGLPPGAAACFHTDGLADVRLAPGSASGRLGPEGVAEELRAVGSEGAAADLLARIVRRSSSQPDDMAACMIAALPDGAEGWPVRLEELEVDADVLNSGRVERFLVACEVGAPQIERTLREARETIAVAGSAVIEVHVGDALPEVLVGPPPAVVLPIGRRAPAPVAVQRQSSSG